MILSQSIAIVSMLLFSFTSAWIPSANTMKSTFRIKSNSLIDTECRVNTIPQVYERQRKIKTCLFDRVTDKQYPLDYTGLIGDIPFFRLHIDENYDLYPANPDRLEQLIDWTSTNNVTDVWVTSHGWLTPGNWAIEQNYEFLFGNFSDLLKEPDYKVKFEGKQFGVVGITWNSLTKNAEENYNKAFSSTDKSKAASKEIDNDDITSFDDLKDDLLNMFGTEEDIKSFGNLIEDVENVVGNLVAEEVEDIVEGIASKGLLKNFTVSNISIPQALTFRTMMGRAAQSGRLRLAGTIDGLRQVKSELRIHLVGHSFGAALVSAAAGNGKRGDYNSLTLLQGAFSKNSFTPAVIYKGKKGVFQHVISNAIVKGPITVTHTKNDTSLANAYYMASSLYNSPQFHGVAIPDLNLNLVALLEPRGDSEELRAVGDLGVGHVASTTYAWPTLRGFAPTKNSDKKFNSIHASDAISDHNDVWTKDAAILLSKVSEISS